MNGGGTVTTAGNLVFAASRDGDFAALSADKGEKLWSVKLLQGFATPVTYMLDGKQYVAVLAGRAGKGRVYTFALDANVPIPPAPPAGPGPAAAAPAPAPAPAPDPNQPINPISPETRAFWSLAEPGGDCFRAHFHCRQKAIESSLNQDRTRSRHERKAFEWQPTTGRGGG